MPLPGARRSTSIALPGARAAAVAFIRGPGTPTHPTQAETTALLAAMTVQPNAARANLINNAIFDLKAAGLWTTFDFFLVFAAHDQQAGRVDWVNPARIITANAGPIFTTDRGYTGDGVAAYLGLTTNLTALTKFTQDNCSMGARVQNNSQGASLIGLATTTTRLTLQARSGSDTFGTRLMTSGIFSTPSVNSIGHWHLTRSSATGYDRYKDGTLIDSPVAASIAGVAEEVTFLRNGTQWSSGQILSFVHAGASLTPAQIASLTAIIQTYMGGVGA